MKNYAFIFKTFFAIFIGLCIALVLIQKDERFKATVAHHVKTFFKEAFDGDIDGTLIDINLLSPRLTFEHIIVVPTPGYHGWTWRAKKGVLYFSWLSLLLKGRAAIHIMLDDYQADSLFENQELLIAHHLQKLFEPPDTPVPAFLKSLQIRRGIFHVVDEKNELDISLNVHTDMKNINPVSKIYFYIGSGTVMHHDTLYLNAIAGSCFVESCEKNKQTFIKTTANCSFDIPQLDKPKCFFQGSWHHDHGQFSLHNSDRSLMIDPLTITTDQQILGTIRIPLALVARFSPTLLDQDIQGSCSAHVTTHYHDLFNTHADILLESCGVKGLNIHSAHLTFTPMNKNIGGTIEIKVNPSIVMQGSWMYDHTQLSLDVHNSSTIQVPGLNYWSLVPESFLTHATVQHDGTMHALYEAKASHKVLDSHIKGSGTLIKNKDGVRVQGDIETKKYNLVFDPAFTFNTFACHDGDKIVAHCKAQDKQLQGAIHYSLIRSLLPDTLKNEVHGEGIISLDVTYNDHDVHGAVSLDKGLIKIPKLYNFINSFNAQISYNFEQKKCVATDISCGLHNGFITSKRATILFNETYQPYFVHLPLIIDSCFVSWQKDLFATLSGSFLYKKEKESSSLAGTLLVDKAQLKGNLFSSELQRSMLSLPSHPSSQTSDLNLDVHCMTVAPLQVQTSFLDAQAKVDLEVKKSVKNPEVSGTIDVHSGELKFPYKPLSIAHGKILISPDQLDDPLIELTAKNKIKKYLVNLQVSGSLKSPHIYCDSSPLLTEAQIISLLLAGAEDSSFNLLMPTLVMQNLQTVIFGPAQSDSKLATYFNSLFKPLAFVRIVPRFSDESGRGGLRAAIEISISDRLNALIEKNFSLPEDTKFEVQYGLTDEVGIRALKDEHGDLGAEMEMRFRF